MKVALFTGIFRNESFETAVRKAAEIGYDGLELRALSHLPPDSTPQQVKEVKRIADHYGLPIPVIYSNISGNYLTATKEEIGQKHDLVKRYTKWAAELGSGMICYGPGKPASNTATEDDFNLAAERLAEAADIMAEAGIKLIVEIHHGGMAETIDSTLKLLNKVQRPNTGAILDPGNMAIAGEEYGALAVERLGQYLVHVHTKDIHFFKEKPEGRKVPHYRNRMFVVDLMGNGHVDHEPAYRALQKAGYDGFVSLEAQVSGVPPEEIAAHEYMRFRQTTR